MVSALSSSSSLSALNSWSASQRQELICFDCLSEALDYRESLEEQIGQRPSIVRLAKSLFGVAPSPLTQILRGAGFPVMVQ